MIPSYQNGADLDAPSSAEVGDEIVDSVNSFIDNFVASLPRLGAAVLIFLIGWLAGRAIRRLLETLLGRKHMPSFARVMSKLAGWFVLAAFVMAGLAVAFPSVEPVDLLAGLGFFSVAVGFAFQDILENTLSGVLLLVREPFQAGDQIEVNGHEGTVDRITIRETRLRQYDGQLLVIPNRDVYKNAIRVQTNEPLRRVSFVAGVAYEDDLDGAQRAILDALSQVDAVADDPEPEALVTTLGVSTVDIEVRFWVDSAQREAKVATSDAIIAVKRALDEGGYEIPNQIVVLKAADSLRASLYDRAVSAAGSVLSE